MGKFFSLLVLLGLGYAGIYFYYGVVIEGEVEFAVARKASDPSEVDNDEFTATTLTPGMVQYVPAFVVHHVTSKDGAIMQLTLHTGDHEGYQGHSGKSEKLPFEK